MLTITTRKIYQSLAHNREKKINQDQNFHSRPYYTEAIYISPTLCALSAYSIHLGMKRQFVEIFDRQYQKLLSTFDVQTTPIHTANNTFISVTSDEKVITATNTEIAEWTNLSTENPVKRKIAELDFVDSLITRVNLPDDNTLLVADVNGHLTSWDLQKGTSNRIAELNMMIQQIHVHENGIIILLGTNYVNLENMGYIFHPQKGTAQISTSSLTYGKIRGQQVTTLVKPHKLALLTSEDAARKPNKISIIDVSPVNNSEKKIKDMKTEFLPQGLTFSPNSQLICTEENGAVEIFDNESYERLAIYQLPSSNSYLIFWNPWNFDEFIAIDRGQAPLFMNLGFRDKLVNDLYNVGKVTKNPAEIVLSYLFKTKNASIKSQNTITHVKFNV